MILNVCTQAHYNLLYEQKTKTKTTTTNKQSEASMSHSGAQMQRDAVGSSVCTLGGDVYTTGECSCCPRHTLPRRRHAASTRIFLMPEACEFIYMAYYIANAVGIPSQYTSCIYKIRQLEEDIFRELIRGHSCQFSPNSSRCWRSF